MYPRIICIHFWNIPLVGSNRAKHKNNGDKNTNIVIVNIDNINICANLNTVIITIKVYMKQQIANVGFLNINPLNNHADIIPESV